MVNVCEHFKILLAANHTSGRSYHSLMARCGTNMNPVRLPFPF